MPLTNPFKLEKLTIKAYSDRKRKSLVKTVEAMFNPSSFSQDWEIIYGKKQGFDWSGKPVDYSRSKPGKLQLDLLYDGTGVDSIGVLALTRKKVSDQIDELLKATFRVNGKTHEPNFLVVEWGKALVYSCRLEKASVEYQGFARDGEPLRAKVTLELVADKTAEALMKEARKSSPDVTHHRVVKAGDTLPLLAKEIYGDSRHYLTVAAANALDDFRRLQPGRELVFPPLVGE